MSEHRVGARRRTAAGQSAALAGLGCLVVSLLCELADVAPLTQLVLGASGGLLLLAASALLPVDSAQPSRLRGWLLTGTGAGALLAVVGLWQASASPTPTILLLLVPVALIFLAAVLATLQARGVTQRAEREQRRAALAAEEAERLRWTRELHDETLQDLAATDMILSRLGSDPSTVADAVEDARAIVGHQIRSLRSLLSQMRPLTLEQFGLEGALEELGQHAGRSGRAEVTVRCDPLPRLDPADELAVYRIAQAALSNALAHAEPDTVTVRALVDRGALRLVVSDDGCGFEPEAERSEARDPAPGQGYGLLGMRERAAALSADLQIRSAPGHGTTVTLTLPLGGAA